MNKERRKRIAQVITQLDQVRSLIEQLHTDESDYYENMPEAFKATDNGMNAEQAVDSLDAAMSNLDEAITNLQNAVG